MMKQRSKQYLSKYKKIGKESDSDEEMELFPKNKPQRKEIPIMDITIKTGDTLQSLAIRYHCTIEDLKRLNNIHRDNEIFAKNTIKVPERPFTMALASVHVSGTSSPATENQKLNERIDFSVLNSRLNSTDREVNEIIFNSNIQQKSCDKTCEDYDNIETAEEVQLLPQEQIPVAETIRSSLNCSGVDGDIPVIALILCIVLVILVGPLIYVFYIAEHSPQLQHHS